MPEIFEACHHSPSDWVSEGWSSNGLRRNVRCNICNHFFTFYPIKKGFLENVNKEIPERKECEHGVPYRYNCDICDKEP